MATRSVLLLYRLRSSSRRYHNLSKCKVFPASCCSTTRTFSAGVASGVKTADNTQLGGDKPLQLKDGKVQREPFAKNLFLGVFDKKMLTYPEVLDKEKLGELQAMYDSVKRFMEDKVDSSKIDRDEKISEEVIQGFRELGLFGIQIPTEYGGLGCGATEYGRFCESFGYDASVAVTLSAHNSIGLKGLLLCGNEDQKRKYLPKLATGEYIAAFCLTEPTSGSDAASIRTTATVSDDQKTFYLNGSKIYITNGGIADFMTVFAKVDMMNEERKNVGAVTAFIVEKGFGGVRSGQPEDKLGIRGSNTTEVFFDNTPVPAENVLGKVGDGFKVAMNILNSGRFGMGCSIAGGLREIIKKTAEYAINRVQFGKPISEFDMIKEKFAKMATLLYAIESMAYMTSAIIDVVENPDCAMEAAMVKVFASEAAMYAVNECLQIHGGTGYMKSLPYEQYFRDTRILPIFEGTNEILRLFIALLGIQHAGKELKELVKKLRNPLNNPRLVLEKMWSRRGNLKDSPTLYMDLAGSLHPSLKDQAEKLEYGVLRFQYTIEVILEMYGKEIINHQMVLKRVADIAIDLYAMTAVLSRASRSYCIGLQNADHEIELAQAFCHDTSLRLRTNTQELLAGVFGSNDYRYKKIADKIFKDGCYSAAHPLTRNW